MIRDKLDLVDWLKENNLYSDQLVIPEVKPYRVSKWLDFEEDFEWMSDTVYAQQVPINFKCSIGGQTSCIMDAQYQEDKVRIRLMSDRLGRYFYTRIKALGEATVKRTDYEQCKSASDLIEKINDQLPYKLMVERQ